MASVVARRPHAALSPGSQAGIEVAQDCHDLGDPFFDALCSDRGLTEGMENLRWAHVLPRIVVGQAGRVSSSTSPRRAEHASLQDLPWIAPSRVRQSDRRTSRGAAVLAAMSREVGPDCVW